MSRMEPDEVERLCDRDDVPVHDIRIELSEDHWTTSSLDVER